MSNLPNQIYPMTTRRQTANDDTLFWTFKLLQDSIWFAVQTSQQLQTSAIAQAEILVGIALMSIGKRRDTLAAQLQLVNRNTKDFEEIDDLQVVNPWQPH